MPHHEDGIPSKRVKKSKPAPFATNGIAEALEEREKKLAHEEAKKKFENGQKNGRKS